MEKNLCPFCPFADECEGSSLESIKGCPMFEDPEFLSTD